MKKSIWFLKFNVTYINKNTSLITIGNDNDEICVYKIDLNIDKREKKI